MRLNRGLLFWGLALITTGAVALTVHGNAGSFSLNPEDGCT